MDAQLRLLLDRMEIRDLVTRYFAAADRRDFADLVGCFVEGTEVDYSDLLPVGPAARIAEVAATIDAAMAANYGPTQHFMGNHSCAVDGDTATAETYCLAIHQYLDPAVDDGGRPTSALRYLDRLVRTPEGWRIAYRRAVRDLSVSLPARDVPGWEPHGRMGL